MILREIQKWTPNNATALLDYAIKFKDDKIWAATSKSHHVTIMVLEDPKVLSAAWSTFGFEKMRLRWAFRGEEFEDGLIQAPMQFRVSLVTFHTASRADKIP